MNVDRAALLGTDAPSSHAQLDCMVSYARASSPPADVCRSSRSGRKRALVTAFGRFAGHPTNASAQIACGLLGRTTTFAPAPMGDDPDHPAPHVHALSGAIELPRAGSIELHVVVLPVMWDLAAMLALAAVARVRPDVVIMNGVGAVEQPIAIEAEASNLAAVRDDASGRLRPRADGALTRILPEVDERRRTLSFDVERALPVARAVWSRHAGTTENGRRLDAIAPSVDVAPGRDENAYLCNQVSYLVDRALAHPDRVLRLLRGERHEGVDVSVDPSLSRTPRGFVHWPSAIAGAHVAPCVELLRAMIDAMLV